MKFIYFIIFWNGCRWRIELYPWVSSLPFEGSRPGQTALRWKYFHHGHSQQFASALYRGTSFPTNDYLSLSLLILIGVISSFSLDLFQCHLVYITVPVTVNCNGVTQAFLPLRVSQSVTIVHPPLYSRLHNTQKAI